MDGAGDGDDGDHHDEDDQQASDIDLIEVVDVDAGGIPADMSEGTARPVAPATINSTPPASSVHPAPSWATRSARWRGSRWWRMSDPITAPALASMAVVPSPKAAPGAQPTAALGMAGATTVIMISVNAVVEAAEGGGLCRKVARLVPLGVVKG